ncbi:MAG: preQ(0) biosynthesis protein QueC, partial [Gammaproteobacteria bacterium]|nr:preQ(0) biosynthesis protein QueC [Gammaproteobacteria bacterium]
MGANDIFTGMNAIDYSGYPDCRPEYVAAYEVMANLATKTAVEGNKLRIHTPLINLRKAEIIKIGAKLNVDYSLTISCYQADEQGRACSKCE